jgi:O-antigen/teichoic acid export membrane protein
MKQTPFIFRATLLICLVSLIMLVVGGIPMLLILVGFDYVGSVIPLVAMLPGVAVFGAARVLGVYLWAKKKPIYGLINNWISLLVLIVLCIAFIPSMGILAAALSFSIALSVLTGLTVAAYCKESGESIKQLIPDINDVRRIREEFLSVVGKFLHRKA